MEVLKNSSDVLFLLLGAVMVLAMHAGFAFLELGTVRSKNQVNALVKILCDFSVSTLAYFFIGYGIAYGVNFLSGAEVLAQKNGYELARRWRNVLMELPKVVAAQAVAAFFLAEDFFDTSLRPRNTTFVVHPRA